MLLLFRRRLVDNAHEAWKWGSLRFMALGGVAQGAVVTCDRLRLSDHLPDWLLQGLSEFSLLCILAAGVARITTSKDGEPHV